MTPLDFRLIAIPFFRLISVHCDYSTEALKRIQKVFRGMRHTSKYLLSTSSFNQQVNKFIGSFHTEVDYHMITSSISSFIVYVIRQSDINSVFHTNAFQMIVPGSNIYETVKNVYPLHNNASVINVS